MPTTQSAQNQLEIKELQKGYAVMETKIDHITQGIVEIKTNHLVHINDQLTVLSKSISDRDTALTALVNSEMGKVYQAISGIKVNNAKAEPGNTLMNEVIKYVILAVIGAGLVLLSKK